jgi:hypothetical protein
LVLLIFINIAALAQSVGDIAFDPTTDNPKFQLCKPDWVWQTYWLKTRMDETPLLVDKEFKTRFKSQDDWENESGLIRIRFIVNCQGVADRYRLLELDPDLNEKKFSESLRAHVLSIAKGIQWPTRRAQNQTVDYYHYFTIRIANGQLVDIIQ